MAQALVAFLAAQHVERDGVQQPFFAERERLGRTVGQRADPGPGQQFRRSFARDGSCFAACR